MPLHVNFGYIKTTSLGSRKNDDRIDFISKYGYTLNTQIKPDFAYQFPYTSY